MPVPAARCGHDHPVTFVGAEVDAPAGPSGARLRLARPGRLVHVAADAAYHGPALVPCRDVTWTCRIPRNAVPYSLVRPAPASAAGPAPRETGPARPMTSPPPRAGRRSPSPPTAEREPARRRGHLPVVRLLAHPDRPADPIPRRAHRQRLRPGPDHHRPGRQPGRPGGTVRRPVGHRAGVRRRPQRPGAGEARTASGAPSSAPSRSPCSCTP